MKPEPPFELDPATYDAQVDWGKRLANEEPLYRQWFERAGVRRVLDAACGTGHHAAMFHSWGLGVQGADLSCEMIAHCRSRYGELERLAWVVRSLLEPSPTAEFDAVICVGNSLALLADLETFDRALATLLSSLRPGGVLIAQVLNLWRLPEGPVQWRSCKKLCGPDGDRIVLKGVHRVGAAGHVSFIQLRLTEEQPAWEHHDAPLLGIRADHVQQVARACGARDIELLGDYQSTPYDADSSPDLILVCRRA